MNFNELLRQATHIEPTVAFEQFDTDIDNSYAIYTEEALALESLQRAANDIDSIFLAIESADGKLDITSVKTTDIGLSMVARTLGMESFPTQVSLEAISEYSPEERYTVTTESIKDTLQKLLLAIKNTILRVWKAISDFFNRIFGGYKAMLKKIDSLKARAAKIKESGIEGKVRVRSMSRLTYGGKFDIKNISRIGAASVFMMETYPKEVTDFFEAMKKVVFSIKATNTGEVTLDFNNLGEYFDEELKATKNKHNWEVYGGVIFNGGDIINNTAGGISALKNLPLLRASPPNFTIKDSDTNESQEIDVLDTHVIENILDQMKKSIDYMDKKKANVEDISKKAQLVRDNIDKQVKSGNFSYDSFRLSSTLSTIIKIMLISLGKNWSAPIVQFVKLTFGVMRSVIDYCEKSIIAYEKASEKKKDSVEPKGVVVNADRRLGYNAG